MEGVVAEIAGRAPTYISSWLITKNHQRLNIDTDDMITIFKIIKNKIPCWLNLVAEARITGIWNNVRKNLDENFGKGAFSILFSLTSSQFYNNVSTLIFDLLSGKIDPHASQFKLDLAKFNAQKNNK